MRPEQNSQTSESEPINSASAVNVKRVFSVTLWGHATQGTTKTCWLGSSVTYYRASCLSPTSEHIRHSGLRAFHSTRHLNGTSQVPARLCQTVTVLKSVRPWTPPLHPSKREAPPESLTFFSIVS